MTTVLLLREVSQEEVLLWEGTSLRRVANFASLPTRHNGLFYTACVARSVVPFKAPVALDSLLFCSDWMLTVDTVVGHLDSEVGFRRIIVG